jgi:uncharacterized repeat protein (TIGR03803 family)
MRAFLRTCSPLTTTILLAINLTALSSASWAATAKVVHSFNQKDGALPEAGLVLDSQGNLYGAAADGGDTSCVNGCGSIFELSPFNGGWKETILHQFQANGTDGTNPYSTLILDSVGNLYGTTFKGGTSNDGTVFELSPSAGGAWTEQILHNFDQDGTDGYFPEAPLTMDAAGNLYGTTPVGGKHGPGIVFKLAPGAGGVWTEEVLYDFQAGTLAGVVLDSSGNLYGTTANGGPDRSGTIYELSQQNGTWTETDLFNFKPLDGATPNAGLIFDSSGNLYGTTSIGGASNNGTVYELTPGSGGWTEKVLWSFDYSDGANPYASLVFDSSGNLYGTTYGGGTGPCMYGCGTVFELIPTSGRWREKLLINFQNIALPTAGVVLDSSGNVYGTMTNGGRFDHGAVFELTP